MEAVVLQRLTLPRTGIAKMTERAGLPATNEYGAPTHDHRAAPTIRADDRDPGRIVRSADRSARLTIVVKNELTPMLSGTVVRERSIGPRKVVLDAHAVPELDPVFRVRDRDQTSLR